MVIKCDIIRTIDNGVQTTGKLYITGDTVFACDTLERTYLNNQKKVSCIPAGKYFCMKVDASEAIPYPHLAILDVPNRDGICIHSGNLYTHSKGCIIVGDKFTDINNDGQQDILHSRKTLEKLMSLLPNEFLLTITEAQNQPFKIKT